MRATLQMSPTQHLTGLLHHYKLLSQFFFPSAFSELYGFQSTPCDSFRRWQHGMWDLSLKCEQDDNRGIKDWGQQADVWRSTVSQHMCQLLVQPSGLCAPFSASNGQFDLAH